MDVALIRSDPIFQNWFPVFAHIVHVKFLTVAGTVTPVSERSRRGKDTRGVASGDTHNRTMLLVPYRPYLVPNEPPCDTVRFRRLGGRGLWLVPRPPTSAGTSCPPPGGHDNGVRSHTHISGTGGLFGHFGSTNSPGSPGPLLSLWDSEEQFPAHL